MKRRTRRGFQNAFVVVVAVFMLAPLVVVVLEAFTKAKFVSFPPPGLSLQWFERVFHEPRFMASLGFSLLIAFLVALSAGVIGTAASYALTRYRFAVRGFFDLLLGATVMVPHVALGIALLSLEAQIGIVGVPWMLYLGHLMIALVFVVRQSSVGLANIDGNALSAAATLGANPWTAFWRITFPQIRGPLVAGCLFAFMISFDEVGVALFLSSAQATTLPVSLYSYMHSNYDPLVMAVGSLLLVIAVIPLVLVDRTVGLARVLGLDDTRRERRSDRRAARRAAVRP